MTGIVLSNITLDKMHNIGQALYTILRVGDTVVFNGDLGAGKSTLCRHIIQCAMGHDTDVPSPTFTLVQTYKTPKGELWHMDWYRLDDADMIFELGVEDAFADGICLIEWGMRAKQYLPKNTLYINIYSDCENMRNIECVGNGWDERLNAVLGDVCLKP
jgi:tRNA threonylcarbamoyladenosine biosynthesis protein TsaE